MENKKALDFFVKISEIKNDGPQSVKLDKSNDLTQYDADFILQYCNPKTSLLDLGSGSGLIINKIYERLNKITAVEPIQEFTKYIHQTDNIEIVNQNIFDYNYTLKKHDLITIFGVMHYFNEEEATIVYKKCYNGLIEGGMLIVKNQFGVDEDVTIDGYSEEQKSNYFAQYRHLYKEIEILKKIGYKNIKYFDIYPKECNRWRNTHFYAIVAHKQ